MSDTTMAVVGALLLAVGIFTVWFCVGIPFLIVGIVLLVYGLVKEDPRPVMIFPAPAYPAAWPSPPASVAVCPVCGMSLQWVVQYQRWYCHRCAAYR